MITAEFNSLDEMLDFAKRLVRNGQADKPESNKAVETPVVATAPEQPKTPVPQQTTQQTTQPQIPTQQAATQVQTTAANYKMDDLAGAAMTLMDSGRQPELLNLLSQFGVDALPSLPQEQYGAFATALRGLGAQI